LVYTDAWTNVNKRIDIILQLKGDNYECSLFIKYQPIHELREKEKVPKDASGL
jgi:hypothetical protein